MFSDQRDKNQYPFGVYIVCTVGDTINFFIFFKVVGAFSVLTGANILQKYTFAPALPACFTRTKRTQKGTLMHQIHLCSWSASHQSNLGSKVPWALWSGRAARTCTQPPPDPASSRAQQMETWRSLPAWNNVTARTLFVRGL